MENMDCLVCHDNTGSYKKAPPAAGMPSPEVDLVHVAKNVGKSNRNTCGECHFAGGGGDAVKHADMCGVLRYPDRNCDIHMGGYDFSCTDCHKTQNHKIWGRSTTVPVAEGSRNCVDCHTEKPHYGESLLDHHLNKHCEHMACNTCHSPVYSKCIATKTWWDWSVAGDKERKPVNDKYGLPDYAWNKGEFCWKEAAKPEYTWFNGYVERVYIGDTVDTEGAVVTPDMSRAEKQSGRFINLTAPVGGIQDPVSRITPFKIMRGVQPIDARQDYFLVPHLFPYDKEDKTAYWQGASWDTAIAEGMKVVGLEYSGEFEWVRTAMYWRIEHEVMPKESALSCVHCHESLTEEKTCDRCHQDGRNLDFKKLARQGADFSYMHEQGRDVSHLIGTTDYIDFKALGYKGDPIIHGGRFKQLPLGQIPEMTEQ
jgi:octaheme c-type cytochrome (tetrathionate reductase family)